MADKQLSVLLDGREVAVVTQANTGRRELKYASDPSTVPLSLSMPIAQRTHGYRAIDPYLEGLLPDNSDERVRLGRRFSVSPRNPFALLTHVGLDCAGAVQFCDPGRVDEVLGRPGELLPLDEAQIARRLERLRTNPEDGWTAWGETWSLAGAQSKFALARMEGGWAAATGSAPTTHIFKSGVSGFRLQALNEHICMKAAANLGLPAAKTEYWQFGDEPAIVVERYDRQIASDGAVSRLHQEDLCQALAVMPENKYQSDGGPTALDMLTLVGDNAGLDAQAQLLAYFAFNYLIGAPDSHAKNFSVMLGGIVTLAPLYDVASSMPYDFNTRSGLNELAVKISGHNRFGTIRDEHWAELAGKAGFQPDRAVEIVHHIASTLPDALSDAVSAPDLPPEKSELADRMLPRVAELCAKALGSAAIV
ncbi:MAG: type II toxin-antitoxin system HipA family toxin [Propionibacteriaceae bacterium]|jgi:serine/threonine-protein kinase HipA|nr:type II toxin-antitoxin system HipA family toxin [Propionibacteriaceae bacterium]